MRKSDATNQLINAMRLISRCITSLSLVLPWSPSRSRACRPQSCEAANQRHKPHCECLCSVDVPQHFGSTALLLYGPRIRLLGTDYAIASCSSVPQSGAGLHACSERCLVRQVDAKACAGLEKLVAAWYLPCCFGAICLLSYRAVRLFCEV